jgi:hypothetical protein
MSDVEPISDEARQLVERHARNGMFTGYISVLALLARLDRAEAERDRLREACESARPFVKYATGADMEIPDVASALRAMEQIRAALAQGEQP